MVETPLGQQVVMDHQLSHTATLTQSSEATGADGMEEHLEGEDSAVKDLEDVEVKDLVDLNLNLDPEDGNGSHGYNLIISQRNLFLRLKMLFFCCVLRERRPGFGS